MYKHVLAAVDLSDNMPAILAAAYKFQQLGASISVVHVCPGRVTGYGEVTCNNHIANEIQLKQTLFPQLKTAVENAGLKDAQLHLLTGEASDTLHKFSDQHGCDLIVVGSHGTEGVGTLLGSTAHAMLQSAQCDVLTVRIYD